MHVLKVKSTITRYVKCFIPGITTSKNLFKEIESVNNNAPGKSTSFEQMLVNKKFKSSLYKHLTKNKTN